MQKVGKIMDSINFSLFFRSKDVNIETLVARDQALRSGAVLEHGGKRYHVQILSAPAEGDMPSKLFLEFIQNRAMKSAALKQETREKLSSLERKTLKMPQSSE